MNLVPEWNFQLTGVLCGLKAVKQCFVVVVNVDVE